MFVARATSVLYYKSKEMSIPFLNFFKKTLLNFYKKKRLLIFNSLFDIQGQSRTPVPTNFGENFDILLVGEDIILPPFIKIALRFARAVGDACPYGFVRV